MAVTTGALTRGSPSESAADYTGDWDSNNQGCALDHGYVVHADNNLEYDCSRGIAASCASERALVLSAVDARGF